MPPLIPNTEFLHRCAQNGIEHHIKRAQLRWSGHIVRMSDDRIPVMLYVMLCHSANRMPLRSDVSRPH